MVAAGWFSQSQWQNVFLQTYVCLHTFAMIHLTIRLLYLMQLADTYIHTVDTCTVTIQGIRQHDYPRKTGLESCRLGRFKILWIFCRVDRLRYPGHREVVLLFEALAAGPKLRKVTLKGNVLGDCRARFCVCLLWHVWIGQDWNRQLFFCSFDFISLLLVYEVFHKKNSRRSLESLRWV